MLDFRPFQTIFLQVCINLSPALQGGGWAGGGEGRAGVGGGGEGRVGVGGWGGRRKTPQVKTRGHQSLPDGPDHPTRPKGHHSSRGQHSRLVTPQLARSTGANVSVMALQGCKPTPLEKQTH